MLNMGCFYKFLQWHPSTSPHNDATQRSNDVAHARSRSPLPLTLLCGSYIAHIQYKHDLNFSLVKVRNLLDYVSLTLTLTTSQTILEPHFIPKHKCIFGYPQKSIAFLAIATQKK